MQILHGTWIPQPTVDFIQQGAFYLWVETTEKNRFRKTSQQHPRQLVAEKLALLLKQEFGVQPPGYRRDVQDLI